MIISRRVSAMRAAASAFGAALTRPAPGRFVHEPRHFDVQIGQAAGIMRGQGHIDGLYTFDHSGWWSSFSAIMPRGTSRQKPH